MVGVGARPTPGERRASGGASGERAGSEWGSEESERGASGERVGGEGGVVEGDSRGGVAIVARMGMWSLTPLIE